MYIAPRMKDTLHPIIRGFAWLREYRLQEGNQLISSPFHIEGCYDRRRFGGRVVRVRHDSKWLFEDVVEEGSEAEVVGENIYTHLKKILYTDNIRVWSS